MNMLATNEVKQTLPSMSLDAQSVVKELENELFKHSQVEMPTSHVLHGGIYARTVVLPAGAVMVGAVIKVPTILIIDGDFSVYTGIESVRLQGYQVIPASAFRKQAFLAHTDTSITMILPTDATDIEQAEMDLRMTISNLCHAME